MSVPAATQQLNMPGIRLCELHNVFDPLIAHVAIINQVRDHNTSPTISGQPTILAYGNNKEELKEMITQVGARVKLKWTKEDIGGSVWHPG